jgi:CRP/FNR family cyclic AMP-dependent transcriptional regulator
MKNSGIYIVVSKVQIFTIGGVSVAIKEEYLKLIPAFNEVKEDTYNKLCVKCSFLKLNKGQTLFREREAVKDIYIVLKGKVTMYRNTEEGQKRVIYILSDGAFINEVIFDGKSASISCETFEDSEIIYIDREELLKLMEFDFVLTKNIIDSMGKKIRRLYRQLKNTTTIRVDKKVAAKLWKIATDHGLEIQEGTMIDLNITITYLADMMGHSRESISRAMKALEGEGLVRYKDKKIVVDKEGLLKYYRSL